MSELYPTAVSARSVSPRHCGKSDMPNAVGNAAALICGTYVRVFLTVDPGTKRVEKAIFRTNGCGFMVAAADVLADFVEGTLLIDLHGLKADELNASVQSELGAFHSGRAHCLTVAAEAIRLALADFRAQQIEEFTGEKALICTCFGVTEETIESLIGDRRAVSVADIGRICSAGTGCGSCQFMIQEMLDTAARRE